MTQVHINRMHLESSIKLNAVIYKERVCGFFVFLIFPPARMKRKKFSSLQDYFLAFILSLLSLDKRIKLQERTNRKENTRYESVVSKTLFFFLSLSSRRKQPLTITTSEEMRPEMRLRESCRFYVIPTLPDPHLLVPSIPRSPVDPPRKHTR